MVKYQSMLCENPCIRLEVLKTLSPATLLPIDTGPPKHDCLEVMDEVFSSWPDLTNQPISNLDVEYFIDGSSFVQDGTCFAGYVVVTLDSVIEAHSLPVGTSAQKAELVTLTWALQLTAGVQVKIYTDSKYAFTTIHVHGALYKEKGLINSRGKSIKHGQEIFELLDAIWTPKQVAITKCQGHQKGDETIAQGNGKAQREAKQVALTRVPAPAVLTAALFLCPLAEWDSWYTPQEWAWFKAEEGNFLPNGWWKFTDNRIAIPEPLTPTFVKQFHEGTHSGRTPLRPPWPSIFMSPGSPT
jgi:ribonuclease HI